MNAKPRAQQIKEQERTLELPLADWLCYVFLFLLRRKTDAGTTIKHATAATIRTVYVVFQLSVGALVAEGERLGEMLPLADGDELAEEVETVESVDEGDVDELGLNVGDSVTVPVGVEVGEVGVAESVDDGDAV